MQALKKQYALAKVRVAAEDYKSNLEKIIRLCRNHDIKLVFIKMPVNLPLPDFTDDERKVIEKGSTLSQFYFEQGKSYEADGAYRMASDAFSKAKDYLILECHRDSLLYQKLMEEIAHANSIPIVDVITVFSNSTETQSLFNSRQDPIHPNKEGHALIAKALFELLIRQKLVE